MSRGLAEPFVPKSTNEVIDRVRSPEITAAAKEIRELERLSAASPGNLEAVLKLARRQIEAGREEADPRYLGRAQSVLKPWLSQGNRPAEAVFLNATVRQGLHDFKGAMVNLDEVLRDQPTHAGAWLTRAMIQCVRADFGGARSSAAHLIRGDELVAMTVAANIASLTGESASASRQLEAVLKRNPDASAKVRSWSLTLLAETAVRRGETEASDRFFRSALELAPRDPYLLGSYADFLLDQKRAADVVALLAPFKTVDSLLLRYAEASNTDRGESIKALKSRIEINRARGDRVHLREEARVYLRLLDRPAEALILARENWAVQKEPADARLVLEYPIARKDSATERELLEFLGAQKLEDVSLGLPVRSH